MKVQIPITEEVKKELKAGDYIYLTGTVYTARDAAHKRLLTYIEEGKQLPIDLKDACIYYTGPTPMKEGRIGSIGPTTGYRMDSYMPYMKEINCTIAKGPRSEQVQQMAKDGVLYLMAIGGIGAKLSLSVKSMEVVGFEDLGPEAIYKLQVEDFPVIVAYDIHGNKVF